MILVDSVGNNYLKISFRYCNTYASFMRDVKKRVSGTHFDYDKKVWYVPKDGLKTLEDVVGERLVWITPKWKIYNLKKPNYEELYNIENHKLPSLHGLALFKYQEFGVNFMIDRLNKYKFVINCDDVGLGKSIQSIVTQEWMKQNKGVKKTLLICPKTLKVQWKDEVYGTFTPNEETFLVKTGLTKKKRDEIYSAFAAANSGTLIMNFHLFLYDKETLKKMKIDYVIIDEAQDIATHGGKINSAIKTVVKKIPYLTILTATPIKSKPDNLYAIFHLKNESILGKWDIFSRHHIDYEKNRFGVQKVGYKNLSELKNIVDDYVIRRTEHEVDLELPEVISKVFKIELDDVQEDLFAKINENKKEASLAYNNAKMNNKISADKKEMLYGRVMLHATTGRAVADDPRLLPLSKSKFIRTTYGEDIPEKYSMSPKTELCIDLVKEIVDNNHKVIIYTEFERQVRLLKKDLEKAFKDEVILSVTGETDDETDSETIALFKKDPDYKVLIGTSALQTGHNLQIANFVIHFDLPQAQDGIRQRRGRARRVGSKHKKIKEYFLLSKDSPEIAKFDNLKFQKHMSNGIFNPDEEQQRIIREKSNK